MSSPVAAGYSESGALARWVVTEACGAVSGGGSAPSGKLACICLGLAIKSEATSSHEANVISPAFSKGKLFRGK
jgi:hypothetical protein